MFSIIKKTANVWHHTNDTQTVHLSTFGVVTDITAQTFIVRALNGAFFPRQAVSINEIQVIDETGGGTPETFGTIDELLARLIQLQYPPYKTSGGGGGGAVDSVNGQTGDVVLDADDISETATRFWLTSALKTAYDGAVAWIVVNGANILNHIGSTSNPHNVTKAQVGLGDVDNTSDLNKPISTATQTALNGKVTLNAWVDISLTSTITGWSVFTTNVCRYVDCGNYFIYYVMFHGTSNSTNVTFTIHYTPAISLSQFGGLFSINNGASLAGLAPISITAGSNIVSVPVAQNTGTSWVASGVKAVRGIFILPKL